MLFISNRFLHSGISRWVMVYDKRYTFKLKDPNSLRDIIFQNVLLQRTLFLKITFKEKVYFGSVLNDCISIADTQWILCSVRETEARFCDYLWRHRRMCMSLGLFKSMNMTKICGNYLSRKRIIFWKQRV